MGFPLESDAADHVPAISQLCRYLTERSPQPMVAVEETTHLFTPKTGAPVPECHIPARDPVPNGCEISDSLVTAERPAIQTKKRARDTYESATGYAIQALHLDHVFLLRD